MLLGGGRFIKKEDSINDCGRIAVQRRLKDGRIDRWIRVSRIAESSLRDGTTARLKIGIRQPSKTNICSNWMQLLHSRSPCSKFRTRKIRVRWRYVSTSSAKIKHFR